MDLSTLAIHADDEYGSSKDVAPAMHVSTTFRYPVDHNICAAVDRGFLDASVLPIEASKATHVYSRDSTETRDRLEAVLGSLESAFAVTYSSGSSAFFAALQFYQPKQILMPQEGYHGAHGVVGLYTRSRNVKVLHLTDSEAENKVLLQSLQKSDLLWLESPQNPRGEVSDLDLFKKHCASGVVIGVDSTFAPPPIQCMLSNGAHIVMHSSTKYLGGHSDLLGGVLMTKEKDVRDKLLHDREFLGSVMGQHEAWLLLRSLRTFHLRVLRQSRSAAEIAAWLNSKLDASSNDPALDVVRKVWHASIPDCPGHDAAKRQGNGWSGVLSIEVRLQSILILCTTYNSDQNYSIYSLSLIIMLD